MYVQLDTSFKQEKLLLHEALIIKYRKRERERENQMQRFIYINKDMPYREVTAA